VVDALSRRVHELHATTISMYQTDIKGRISEATNTNLQYRDLIENLQQCEMPQKVENYKLETDGTLLYKNIIYIPNI
jgi:ribonuclease HI